jgi:hypothetical protein
MQRVASIFKKLCPLAMKCQVYEWRLISINVDEGKSTKGCVFEVDQLNRDQPAVDRAKTRHSARNRMLTAIPGSQREFRQFRSPLFAPQL